MIFDHLHVAMIFSDPGVLEYSVTSPCLKGVLHPRPVFGLFLHFYQKLQHIGNK